VGFADVLVVKNETVDHQPILSSLAGRRARGVRRGVRRRAGRRARMPAPPPRCPAAPLPRRPRRLAPPEGVSERRLPPAFQWCTI
jgi:hypothetical protein